MGVNGNGMVEMITGVRDVEWVKPEHDIKEMISGLVESSRGKMA